MTPESDGSCAVHFCTATGHCVCDYAAKWIRDVQGLLQRLVSDPAYSEAANDLLKR